MRSPEGPEREGGANDDAHEDQELYEPASEQAAAPEREPGADEGAGEGATAAEAVDSPPADEDPIWRERAAFRVSFDYSGVTLDEAQWRTRIYHEELDTHEQWEGIEGPRLLAWMRAQGELPALDVDAPQQVEQVEPAEAVEATEEDFPILAMGELWLAEVLIAEELGGPRVPRIGPSYTKRVRSQLSFTLSNSAAIAATMRHSRYVVQVLSCDLATGQQLVLAEDSQSLQPLVDEYHSVSEFNLPDVGRYRVLATVLLPDEGAAGLALGPVLTVVV